MTTRAELEKEREALAEMQNGLIAVRNKSLGYPLLDARLEVITKSIARLDIILRLSDDNVKAVCETLTAESYFSEHVYAFNAVTELIRIDP